MHAWKLRVGLSLSGAIVAILFLAVAIFGLYPPTFPPPLHAQDLAATSDKLRAQIGAVRQDVSEGARLNATWRVSQIDAALLDVRAKHCKAKTDEGRRLYWNSISSMLAEYQNITGRSYALPACSDL